jgi:hypothetical protein
MLLLPWKACGDLVARYATFDFGRLATAPWRPLRTNLIGDQNMRTRALFAIFCLLSILGAASPDAGNPAPILAADPPGRTCTLRCETDKRVTCTSRSGDCQYFVGGLNDVIVCDGNPTTCPLPAP